ncbi:MAG: uroporphyrinogen-III synthase [Proteobacteria bacterium]|nr:uroporphyrinogen-III synthase [Pseudomonadota bacterium]
MKSVRVLVTRPRDDADELTAELERRGHLVAQLPLLDIRYLNGVALHLESVQAVLLTSANGARALSRVAKDRHDLAIFAVGDATAKAARAAGFSRISSAAGDATALAGLVARELDPAAGPLVHVGGRQVAGDLAGSLREQGFAVDRVALYEVIAAERMDPAIEVELREHRIDAVLFFSARTAATFVALVQQTALSQACASIDAVCLSDAVAEEITAVAWHRVKIAARADQPSLLDALDSGDLSAS